MLAPLVVCGIALYAADVWKTKDSSQWTSEDIQKILTDSPWAKQANLSAGAGQRPGGMGRGGGMGGGMGMPGGMGRGGLGMPGGMGGGMGTPNGGWGGGRGGRGGEGRRPQSVTATIRWDSSAPVKQALLRERPADATPAEAAKTPDASLKDYVITVVGLPTGGRRPSGDDSDASNGDDSRPRQRDPAAIREELMESTMLVPKGKPAIRPEDVKIDTSGAGHEIHFLFPRQTPLSKDDKEVTFETQLGRMKLEKKFNLKEMMYQGKLEL